MTKAIEFGEWMEQNVSDTDENKWEYADVKFMLEHAPERLLHLGVQQSDDIDNNTAAIFNDGSILEWSADASDCWVLSPRTAWVSTSEKFKAPRPFYLVEHCDTDDDTITEVLDAIIAEAFVDCEDSIDEDELRDELLEELAATLKPAHFVAFEGWTPKS